MAEIQKQGDRGFGAHPGHSRRWSLPPQVSLVDSGASGGTTEVKYGCGVCREKTVPSSHPAGACLLWGVSGPSVTCPQDSALTKAVAGPTSEKAPASLPGLCRSVLVSGVSASACFHSGAGHGNWISVVPHPRWVMFLPPFLTVRNLPNAINPLTLIVVLHSEPGARDSQERLPGRPAAAPGLSSAASHLPQHQPSLGATDHTPPPALPTSSSQPGLLPSPSLPCPPHFFLPVGVPPILRG